MRKIFLFKYKIQQTRGNIFYFSEGERKKPSKMNVDKIINIIKNADLNNINKVKLDINKGEEITSSTGPKLMRSSNNENKKMMFDRIKIQNMDTLKEEKSKFNENILLRKDNKIDNSNNWEFKIEKKQNNVKERNTKLIMNFSDINQEPYVKRVINESMQRVSGFNQEKFYGEDNIKFEMSTLQLNEIRGNRDFLLYFSNLKNMNYINELFKYSGTNELKSVLNEFQEDIENGNFIPFNLIMFMKLFQINDLTNYDYLEWFHENLDIFSKKYSVKLIDYIIDKIDLNKIPEQNLIKLLEINTQLYHKNFKLISHVDKLCLEKRMNTHPTLILNILEMYNNLNIKKNDEYFGEILTKFFLNNNYKMDFNLLSNIMILCLDFNIKHSYPFKVLEHSIFQKFTELNRSTTVRRLTESFLIAKEIFKENFEILNFLSKLVQSVYMLSINEIKLMSLLVKEKYITNEFETQEIKRNFIRACSNIKSSLLKEYIETYYNLFVHFGETNLQLENKFDRCFQETIKFNSFIDFPELIDKVIKLGVINILKINSISQTDIKNIVNIHETYFTSLQVMHIMTPLNLSSLSIKEKILNTHFDIYDKFISLVKYLNWYQNEKQNQFYQEALIHFINEVLLSDIPDNYLNDKNLLLKLKMLFFPIIQNLIDEKFFKLFIIKHKQFFDQFRIKYSEGKNVIPNHADDFMVFAIINILDNSTNTISASHNKTILTIDLDDENSFLFKIIKTYADFSNDNMESFYNLKEMNIQIKFISSLNEKNLIIKH